MQRPDEARPIRVLVLEDEPLILMELSLSLEDEGVEPLTATNCSAAHDILETVTVSAAILDVNLGRNQTCEAVAAILSERRIPFILHSGDLMRQGELIERIGAEVIPKPAASRVVARRVSELARGTITAE